MFQISAVSSDVAYVFLQALQAAVVADRKQTAKFPGLRDQLCDSRCLFKRLP